MQDIFIQSKVIDIFPKFKMAAATILDFQFMWIWPFRRVDGWDNTMDNVLDLFIPFDHSFVYPFVCY